MPMIGAGLVWATRSGTRRARSLPSPEPPERDRGREEGSVALARNRSVVDAEEAALRAGFLVGVDDHDRAGVALDEED